MLLEVRRVTPTKTLWNFFAPALHLETSTEVSTGLNHYSYRTCALRAKQNTVQQNNTPDNWYDCAVSTQPTGLLPGNVFPPQLLRKPLVGDPGMHHRHSRAVMQVGIANPRLRGKRSRHSRRMRNPQFYVYGKRAMIQLSSSLWRI